MTNLGLKITSLLIIVLLTVNVDAIDTLFKNRLDRINSVKCQTALSNLTPDGNSLFTASIQLAQNMFRDMATSSSGEVRNKFRKDISRMMQKIQDTNLLTIDAKLFTLFKALEDTGVSIEDAGKKATGVDFSSPIKLKNDKDPKNKNLCVSFQDAADELVNKMEQHQNNNDLMASVAALTVKLIGAGLSAGAAAASAGTSVVGSGIFTALAGADGLADASWFSSKLNSIMRVTRSRVWGSLGAIANPEPLKLSYKDGTNTVTLTCNPAGVVNILNDLKFVFKSLITKTDRDAIRADCREGGDKDGTYRISSGQTAWKNAIKAFRVVVEKTDYGKAMMKAYDGISDPTSAVVEKSKD